ncbi:MAG TPA: cyclic peptide export ABC transporter [Candidatus Aquabacterium excrementipullorum]|nr:cyclic peptide export ABC transporter [Candidatus Aquabacterium excrementipullorum]
MLSFLIQQSRGRLLAACVASALAGVCGVLLVAQINTALTADGAARSTLAWQFAAVAVGAMLSRMAASVLFEHLRQSANADLRRHIAERANAAGFRQLEQVGAARVQSALAEHAASVAQFFVSMPTILTNAVIVVGCLVYLALLSWQVFLIAIVVIGLGSVGYHLAHLRAIRHLNVAAREQDQLFGHFRAITDGAKELRLNRRKRGAFTDEVLGESIETVRRERAVGMSIFVASTSWGHFLIYAFIGLVLFALVGDVPERTRVMTGFALVFVYMVPPLEGLLVNIPHANLARSASNRIEEITKALQSPEATAPAASTPTPFHQLSLQGVRHSYHHEQRNEVFTLGPIDLHFAPGEIVFLVGGNGSGKTTLAKLITGLYAPEHGRILLNGQPVDDGNRDQYRQIFSAVFSDFHLFDRLLESANPALDAQGNGLIERLHLQHKVQVKDGAFTTQALSQGQRKRLALVAARLEDRPFLVFDEWAADQDPAFKEVFYKEVLPELRAQGKTVLVISHDDRYFHLGDRLVRLESGQLVADAVTDGVARAEAA